MNTFWKYSPWISKFILLPPTAIFIMISVRHVAHPVAEAALQGIAFTNPLGATVFRVGFAGFPLAVPLSSPIASSRIEGRSPVSSFRFC